MSEKKNLAGKIAAISKDLGAIQKGGHNKEQHYDFIEYAAVSGKIRELLDKHGVAIIPSVTSYERDDVKSKSGATGYHYMLQMHFTVINSDDSADKIEADWMGESTDWGDKGINKAETSGTKYFYMRLFNISEKGDADNDPDNTSGASSESAPAKAKTTSGFRVDFNSIRETCDTIDDIESLKAYYTELKSKNPAPGQLKVINDIISKAKARLAER
jgi:hypothetical protein